MKYAWIAKNKAAWPVTVTCEVLGVSASGYFEHQRWRRTSQPSQPGGGRLSGEAMLAHIRAIHAEVKGEYGWPRVWKKLLARGIRVGKARVQQLMHTHGIKASLAKRKFVVTTDSKHDLPIAENLLAHDFTPLALDRVWSSDITYIATDEGWLYLSAVIDLFSRQVVGWSMQSHMQASLVTDALRVAWFRRHPAPGLIFRSDHGSQYCSHSFQDALASCGMLSSMSRRGNCWVHAPIESLWVSLKVGWLYGKKYATQREAMDEVIDWLTFYNHRRLHSTLEYVSPMRFGANWQAGQARKAAQPSGYGLRRTRARSGRGIGSPARDVRAGTGFHDRDEWTDAPG